MLFTDRARIMFCRTCGNAVNYRIPADDNRERAVCPACGLVDYENPLNVVGTVKESWMKSLIVSDKPTVARLADRLKRAGSLAEYQQIGRASCRERVWRYV